MLTAVLAAALVLGIAAASGSLFLSSASNEALRRELTTLSDIEAGMTITAYGPGTNERYDDVDSLLAKRVAGIGGLGEPFQTVIGDSVRVTGPGVSEDGDPRLRFIYRPGAEDNIEILERSDVEGVWVPSSIARTEGIEAGDTLQARYGNNTEEVPVAAIYRDLSTRPLNDFWSPLTFAILPTSANQPPPPPLVITPRELMFDTSESLGTNLRYQWEVPLIDDSPTAEEAQALQARRLSLELDLRDEDTAMGAAIDVISLYVGGIEVSSGFPGAVQRVEETTLSITGPIELLSLAGRIVALIVFAAAGVFAVQRRRVEVRLLSSQGVSPLSQGVRAAIESVLPALVGAVAGWGIAYHLVKTIGPTSSLGQGVEREALGAALWTAAIAVGLYGLVTMFAARREVEAGSARLRGIVARTPWEAVVLALAGASFYEIVTRSAPIVSSPGAAPKVDIFLLLFPILFITGMAGVAGRGLRRLLPSIGRLGDRSGPPLYLASRRLAGASRIALLLITATSISLGVLVYASVVVASNQATARAKANISVGADVAVPVLVTQTEEFFNTDFPFKGTIVARTEDGELQPGDVTVDTLGIDEETFAGTAFFDGSFADASLEELVRRLRPFEDGRLTAILVAAEEEVPEGSVYLTPRYNVPLDVVGTATAWPGLNAGRPMLVARFDTLFAVSDDAESSVPEDLIANYEVWAEGDAADVRAGLLAEEITYNPFSVRSTEQVLGTPSFLALRWTFSYLQALGIMAGAIALAGMLLYLQTRQQAREVSYALARRMGLSRPAHRRAIAFELGGMLIISLVIGAGLALVSSLLIYSRLDPLPTVPPAPLLAISPLLFVVLIPVIALAASLGAWRVQRKADTAKVSEVLRYAG